MTGFSVNVSEHFLPNGLKVLIAPLQQAPIVSLWAFYRVGSRHEQIGITGISHWVEHMLFKGTPKFPKGKIARIIQKHGGTLNGHTTYDHTAYFETLPKENWLIALEIEADRMTNALFEPQETELERGVILSELEMYENHPEYRLFLEVIAAAFQVHPYRNPIIGWRCDLERMTRDDLYEHYRKFYAPNNAFLVLSGDITPEEALPEVEKRFNELQPSSMVKVNEVKEPKQRSERRVKVKGHGELPLLMMVFHAPTYENLPKDAGEEKGETNQSNSDNKNALLPYAMHILADVLGKGRTSRLYRKLVETQKAVSVWVGNSIHKEEALFSVFVTLTDQASLPEVEDIVWSELTALTEKPPEPDELERVLHMEQADFLRSLDGVTERAYHLGAYEILGDWNLLNAHLPNLQKVTTDLLVEGAKQVFSETNRTVGWFEPVKG
ncbi:MAG: insulinase family protein [Armatimonadetes bacterium]|nr:insulinase family protein [Armatimonadota bacterium]MDW8028636.1 pitrilysin family protein [Armatimonadota bacterium]